MLQQELEALAGRPVTADQFKMIEDLYMACDLDKIAFVKSIRPILKAMPLPPKRQYYMIVHNAYGDCKTPNGCYYLTVKVTIESVNIKTGKTHLRVVPNSFETVGYLGDVDHFNDWDPHVVIDE